MERSVEVLAIILFGVIGLSHVVQPRGLGGGLRMMARVSVERSWECQVAGAVLLALAGILGYGVYAG